MPTAVLFTSVINMGLWSTWAGVACCDLWHFWRQLLSFGTTITTASQTREGRTGGILSSNSFWLLQKPSLPYLRPYGWSPSMPIRDTLFPWYSQDSMAKSSLNCDVIAYLLNSHTLCPWLYSKSYRQDLAESELSRLSAKLMKGLWNFLLHGSRPCTPHPLGKHFTPTRLPNISYFAVTFSLTSVTLVYKHFGKFIRLETNTCLGRETKAHLFCSLIPIGTG